MNWRGAREALRKSFISMAGNQFDLTVAQCLNPHNGENTALAAVREPGGQKDDFQLFAV